MPLSFSQPCSWALLVLLVSNVLLWENVASAPLNNSETDEVYLKELFDHAMLLYKNISDLNLDLPRIFIMSVSSEKGSNKFISSPSGSSNQMLEFLSNREFLVNLFSCHNYSIKTPENMDEAQKISLKDFPKLILSRMQAWNDTLHNLLIILGSMPGTYSDALSLAKDIRTKTAELFEDTKSILSKIYGTTKDVDYTLWSGLEDIQSSDEDSRLFVLFTIRQDASSFYYWFLLEILERRAQRKDDAVLTEVCNSIANRKRQVDLGSLILANQLGQTTYQV